MNKLQEYVLKYQGLHDGSGCYYSLDSSDSTKPRYNKDAILFDGSQLGRKFPPYIKQVIGAKGRAITLLDYGCGQATHVHKALSEHGNKTLLGRLKGMVQCYYCYDPAVKKYSMKPPLGMEFDLLCCADVMEHVPEEFVSVVLTELGNYTKKNGALIFSISANTARKIFHDGENLHTTLKSVEWWVNAIQQYIGNKSFLLFHTDNSRLSEGDEKEKATIIKYYNSERFRVWNLDGIERAEEIV